MSDPVGEIRPERPSWREGLIRTVYGRPSGSPTLGAQAGAARRDVELVLDHLGGHRGVAAWPWHAGLSRWIDVLVLLEETAR